MCNVFVNKLDRIICDPLICQLDLFKTTKQLNISTKQQLH